MPQRLLSSIALTLLLMVVPAAAQTAAPKTQHPAPQSAAANAVTPDQARRALETLQDDAKRTQLIDTLRTIAKTSAPAADENAAPAPPATAEKPATPAGDDSKVPALSADSLGAQLLLTISGWVSDVSREIAWAARNVTHFSALGHWLTKTATDPAYRSLLYDIAWKFVLVFGCAFGVEWLLWWALQRPLRALVARIPRLARAPAQVAALADPPSSAEDIAAAPGLQRRRIDLTRLWQAMLRLPFVLGGLVLELLPVLAFVAVGSLMLGTPIGDVTTTRLAILAILNAYALSRALICAVRALVGPLGLLVARDETAAYMEIWARRIVAVGVGGVTFANVALLLGLHPVGYAALLRLVMLAVHLFVVVIILQSRHQVARWIRASQDRQGLWSATRNRAARYWHYPAIAIVLALWLVWALNVHDGYILLLKYVAGTIAVLVMARVLSIVVLSLIDRGFRINAEVLQRVPGLEARANRYLPLLRKVASGIIAVIAGVALLQVWGVDAIVWFYGGKIGSRLVSAAATVGIAAFIAIAVWEASNALMENRLTALTSNGQVGRAARLQTFQPMLRTALFCVIIAIVGLTALSEIGVNVAPLLAGAGIIGIAIGFGSQKLVQDVITGLFLLLENVVQVGNYVTVSGLSGTVENLSIRTIRLRATDGAVHVVPFSAVTSLTNFSTGIGNADVRVSVGYQEDTDRVCDLLKEIAIEMRKEPEYEAIMRSDLNLWGVDEVDGLKVTIVGKIACVATSRWALQREYKRRLKRRFQQEGIQIAASNQSLMVPVERRQVSDDDVTAKPAQRRAAG